MGVRGALSFNGERRVRGNSAPPSSDLSLEKRKPTFSLKGRRVAWGSVSAGRSSPSREALSFNHKEACVWKLSAPSSDRFAATFSHQGRRGAWGGVLARAPMLQKEPPLLLRERGWG
jgi:hypothetical protein